MGLFNGEVVLVTGAGRGIGRAEALIAAREGAKVVVNDLGGGFDGTGADTGPAQAVVDEITAAGGEAVANTGSVSSWSDAEAMVNQAIDTFGDLHAVINNAGVLRDRMLVNMTEDDWDTVMAVHLKGTFGPTRHAAGYWRERSKAGDDQPRRIVNTTSGSGLYANIGQANYGAAKSGIATLTQIAAKELARYGVRVNAISPVAATRMTLSVPGADDRIDPDDPKWQPTHPATLAVYLASPACRFTGQIFRVFGSEVTLQQSWGHTEFGVAAGDDPWEPGELAEALESLPAEAPINRPRRAS
jgi:NAD(P)-dependent dehydrogenase (short-subunit alcohol dehydrogenase family)